MTNLRGTWFVVPTAFHPDGSLDVEGQRHLVDTVLGWGVDGLTLLGVTSEAPALSEDERARALQACVEAVGGRIPLVVGCSGDDAETVVRRCGEAAAAGAAAAMVAAPPAFSPVEDLPLFFADVAKRGGLDLVVQDEPKATGVVVPVDILVACLHAAGSRTVKLEDPPTPPKIAALVARDPDLSVFGGLGGAAALYELRRGARGTMTGFAFPEILAEVRTATESGDHARAAAVFDRFLPMIHFEAQPVIGLAVRKELLRRRGALPSATTRGVVRELDPDTAGELDDLLERLGIVASAGALPVAALDPRSVPSVAGEQAHQEQHDGDDQHPAERLDEEAHASEDKRQDQQ